MSAHASTSRTGSGAYVRVGFMTGQRALAVTLALLPGPALAEVCDKARPLWRPSHGPVTLWSEPFYALATHFGLALIALAVLGILTRWRSIAIPAGLLLTVTTLAILADTLTPDPSGVTKFARREGCQGPPHLLIAIMAAISLATLRAAILGPRRNASRSKE